MPLTDPFTGMFPPATLSHNETVQALRLDAMAELDAINLYQAHLNTLTDDDAKETIGHIIVQEKEHLAELVATIAKLDPAEAQYLSQLQETGGTVIPFAIEAFPQVMGDFESELEAFGQSIESFSFGSAIDEPETYAAAVTPFELKLREMVEKYNHGRLAFRHPRKHTISLNGGRQISEEAAYKEMKETLERDIERRQGIRPQITQYDFPRAGEIVDGLEVLDDVPNMDSISASFDDYTILPGIRVVRMDDFPGSGVFGKSTQYGADGYRRVEELTEEIRESGKIKPLIVAVDAEGPYILEGGHRIDALWDLGKKEFPALVVIDESEEGEARASIKEAREARLGNLQNAALSKYSEEIRDNWTVRVHQERDAPANKRLETEYDRLRKSYPMGNPNHPETKRFYELRELMKNPIMKDAYYLVSPDGRHYKPLNKTEWETLSGVLQPTPGYAHAVEAHRVFPLENPDPLREVGIPDLTIPDGILIDPGLASATKCTRMDLGPGRKQIVFSPGIVGALTESQKALYCQQGIEERPATEHMLEHLQAMSDAAKICEGEVSEIVGSRERYEAFHVCIARELTQQRSRL